MKAQFKLNDKIIVELEGDTMVDIFKGLAEAQEVLGDLTCTFDGKKSEDTRFVVRQNADEDEFFELWYDGSDPHFFGCKKQFGCKKKPKGALFPKVKDGEGNLLAENIYKNKGWTKYDKNTQAVT